MDNEKLIAYIDAAEQSSYSSDVDSQLSADRAMAINLYNGADVDPVPEGRSSVVDMTVFETIQWIKPSLARIFANGDDVVEIIPVGPEDEAGAKQESQYLNHVILQKNNWFEIFDTWSMDALLTKNGYCLAYSEEKIVNEVEYYKRQTEEGLKMLAAEDVEIEAEGYPDPDQPPQPVIGPDGQPQLQPLVDENGQPQLQMTPMGPQPIMQPVMQQPMLYDVTVKTKKREKQVCLQVLPPERVKVSYYTPSFRINERCPYFEYFDFKTHAELKADGFDVPADIPESWSMNEEEDTARDQYNENTWMEPNEMDPAMKRFKVRMIWIRADIDGDGIAELIYCVRIGQEIIYSEQVSRIPVASMCLIPNPHRHIATSVAEITAPIQRIKTAILRQGLDNLYLSNNQRTYVNQDKVNIDDVLVSVPGGVVRGSGVYGQDISPMQTPFVFPQAMEGLEYMDQVRENRTGTNRYFTGIDQNAMNKTATGIQQLSSMAAQRVEQMARIAAIGVTDLFSIVHELILKGGHKKEVVKLNNNWVEIDPAQWKKRTDFRISVGYAAGNKDALINRLMLIAQFQEKAAMSGAPIVGPENLYETAIELTKASDFAAPQRFWTNPQSAPPKPPPQPDVTVMAAEQLKSQTALQAKKLDVEQKERDSQRDYAIKQYQIDMDAKLQAGLALHQSEQQKELADHSARSTVDMKMLEHQLNPERMQAETDAEDSNMHREAMQQMMQQQSDVNQKTMQMFQAILEAISKMAGPKKVLRGKDGKVESVVPYE